MSLLHWLVRRRFALPKKTENFQLSADWLAVYVALLVAVLIRLGLFPSIPW